MNMRQFLSTDGVLTVKPGQVALTLFQDRLLEGSDHQGNAFIAEDVLRRWCIASSHPSKCRFHRIGLNEECSDHQASLYILASRTYTHRDSCVLQSAEHLY